MMAKSAICVLAVCLSVPKVAAAADLRPVVAVFDIEDTRAHGQKLPPGKLRSMTDYLATRLAVGGRFKIVPRASVREAIEARKKESYKKCYDEKCQIEIGREIAAQKSLATRIDALGDECIVTSTLFDLRQSATENSATYRGPCGQSEILTAIEQIASKLRGDTAKKTANKNNRFDTSGLPAVPVLQMPSESDDAVSGVDFSNVDVDAMDVFDAAVKAEEDDSVSVDKKIALWKEVEKKVPAYRKHASERIIAWKNHARQKKRIEAIQKKRAAKLRVVGINEGAPESIDWPAWITLGSAVLVAGVGGAMGGLAQKDQNDMSDLVRGSSDWRDLKDSAETKALVADVMYGLAGAAAVTSLILFLVINDEEQTVSAGVSVTPSGGAVSFGMRF